jgi:hypothetical protein
MANSFRRTFTLPLVSLLVGCVAGILLQKYSVPGMLLYQLSAPADARWADFDVERTEVDIGSIPREGLMVALTFGQSNAANNGETPLDSGPGVFNFYDGKLYRARDPLLGATGRGGSPWTRLGDRLIESGRYRAVVFAPIAVGQTLIRQWVPGGEWHHRIVDTIRDLERAELKISHLLWHQGESDAKQHTSGVEYSDHFASMLESIRLEGVDAPIYVSVATWTRGTHSVGEIADAQRSLVDHRKILSGPDTDAMGFCGRFDGTHFSTDGLVQVADLWMNALTRQSEVSRKPRDLGPGSRGPN